MWDHRLVGAVKPTSIRRRWDVYGRFVRPNEKGRSNRTYSLSLPIDELQPWNARELGRVVSDESHSVSPGDGGDQQVVGTNRLSHGGQMRPQFRRIERHCVIERDGTVCRAQFINHLLVGGPMFRCAATHSVLQFGENNGAEYDVRGRTLLQLRRATDSLFLRNNAIQAFESSRNIRGNPVAQSR